MKKRLIASLLSIFMLFFLTACSNTNVNLKQEIQDDKHESDNTEDASLNKSSADSSNTSATSDDNFLDEDGMIEITITIGNQAFDAKFYDNESTRTIISEMPFSLEMNDYTSQEKVTELSFE